MLLFTKIDFANKKCTFRCIKKRSALWGRPQITDKVYPVLEIDFISNLTDTAKCPFLFGAGKRT